MDNACILIIVFGWGLWIGLILRDHWYERMLNEQTKRGDKWFDKYIKECKRD